MKRDTKRLLHTAVLLGGAALLRFGGEGVLSLFGMGWRYTPQYVMDVIIVGLLMVAMYRCMKILERLAGERPSGAAVCSFSAVLLILAMAVLPCAAWMYSVTGSWHDSVVIRDGQSVVIASNGHGSIGERRYFSHINGLVHGTEIEHDDLW